MSSLPGIGLGILLTMLAAPFASAQSWSSAVGEDGQRAGGLITMGETTLAIACARDTGSSLSIVLSGSPLDGMSTADGETETLTLSIAMQSGATGEYPIDGFYLDDEDTFVGRLVADEQSLRQFAQGMELTLTNASGSLVFSAPMTGTGALRGEIRDACGI